MRVLITVVCGFVGSSATESLVPRREGLSIYATDNLLRTGAESNRSRLRNMGVRFVHGDIRAACGGRQNAMSLAQLTAWSDKRFGRHVPDSHPRERPYDVSWVVMYDSDAQSDFGWRPEISINDILKAIPSHAEQHPDWLQRSGL